VRESEHDQHREPPALDDAPGERTLGTFKGGTTKQTEGEHDVAVKV
jgi:hypothetical protein